MKKKKLFEILIASIMLILIAFTPTLYADENILVNNTSKDQNIAPIPLIYQFLIKLRHHKDIQNIETRAGLLSIIEEDQELSEIFVQLSDLDCGCEDESVSLEWKFPILCTALLPLFAISFGMFLALDIEIFLDIMYFIGGIFNCWWYV